jgi:hypothetical protein
MPFSPAEPSLQVRFDALVHLGIVDDLEATRVSKKIKAWKPTLTLIVRMGPLASAQFFIATIGSFETNSFTALTVAAVAASS